MFKIETDNQELKELVENLYNNDFKEQKGRQVKIKMEESLYQYYHQFTKDYKKSEVIRDVMKSWIRVMDILAKPSSEWTEEEYSFLMGCVQRWQSYTNNF